MTYDSFYPLFTNEWYVHRKKQRRSRRNLEEFRLFIARSGFSDPCILSNFPVSGALISTFVNRHSLNFRALAHILVVQINGELTILRFSHLTGFNPDRQTATPLSFNMQSSRQSIIDKKTASPPHMDSSIVFARRPQCVTYLTRASLGPPESTTQTASRSDSVQPFLGDRL